MQGGCPCGFLCYTVFLNGTNDIFLFVSYSVSRPFLSPRCVAPGPGGAAAEMVIVVLG